MGESARSRTSLSPVDHAIILVSFSTETRRPFAAPLRVLHHNYICGLSITLTLPPEPQPLISKKSPPPPPGVLPPHYHTRSCFEHYPQKITAPGEV